MDEILFKPIGVIRTPFQTIKDMPIQPSGAESVEGQVVVDPVYKDGLTDIDGFSHLILLYYFHQSEGYKLKVKPFLDTQKRGLFATRAPRRPNPIGMSVVSLHERRDYVLHIGRIDVLDGTPLLDVKPYVPGFDAPEVTSVGWLEGKIDRSRTLRSDGRFNKRSF